MDDESIYELRLAAWREHLINDTIIQRKRLASGLFLACEMSDGHNGNAPFFQTFILSLFCMGSIDIPSGRRRPEQRWIDWF